MNLHFFGLDLELNSAYYKINLIFLLCAEPYSRPLAKCFVTPGIYALLENFNQFTNLFQKLTKNPKLITKYSYYVFGI